MNLLICILLSVTITNISGNYPIECESDENCTPSTAKCVNQVCQCPNEQIITYDGLRCVDVAKKYKGKCEIYGQCAIFGGSIGCRDRICQCPSQYVLFRGNCMQKRVNGAGCTTDEDCFDGLDYYSRICLDGKCQCSPGYYDRAGVDCRRNAALGDTCALTLDCKDEGTICEGRICIHKGTASNTTSHNRYKDEDGGDVDSELSNGPMSQQTDGLALNEACEPSDTCADAHALCSPITRTCICSKGYVESTANKACFAELGMTCQAKGDCVAGAECEHGICTCAIGKHYDEANSKCRMAAYQRGDILVCNNNDSCRLLNWLYYCDPTEHTKYCRCESGFALGDQFLCEKVCQSNSDCLNEHEICDEFSKCVCDNEYKMVDGLCKPRIGGACSDDKECLAVVESSHCNTKKSVCACNPGFVSSNYECYPDPEGCQSNSDCLNEHEICDEFSKCVCDDEYKMVDGLCKPRIGGACSNDKECLSVVESSHCNKKKKVCVCNAGYYSSNYDCYQPTKFIEITNVTFNINIKIMN